MLHHLEAYKIQQLLVFLKIHTISVDPPQYRCSRDWQKNGSIGTGGKGSHTYINQKNIRTHSRFENQRHYWGEAVHIVAVLRGRLYYEINQYI